MKRVVITGQGAICALGHSADAVMGAMREGCLAAVEALARDGELSPGRSAEEAADLLWAMLSVRNWELLVRTRGWAQARYVEEMLRMAEAALCRAGQGAG